MMSRVEIKEWSKNYVNGKRWQIWKNLLIYMLINYLIAFLPGFISGLFESVILGALLSIANMFVTVPLSFGIVKLFKNFALNDSIETSDMYSLFKYSLKLVILSLIMALIIMLGYICFVIPGIILSFSFTILPFIYENNKDLGYIDLLKLSYNMMKGHKLDLFVLYLSFIGWIVLSALTFGILYIWLAPYIQMAFTKFFVEVENNYKNN